LDGAQAGLSWITILRKRDNYYDAFDGFDPVKMANYDEVKFESLMNNPGIVRNRQKIRSAIGNAQAYLKLKEEVGSFSDFLWQFVGGHPIQNSWRKLSEIPASTPQSEAMSKALKKHGFNFVGPTIVYAFMQATGLVNDHVVSCFRYKQVKALSEILDQ
jgi:DNA-3-methyladenine glycosylase I